MDTRYHRAMKPVLIVRHVAHEGPAYLGEFFRSHEIPVELLRIDAGEPVPPKPDRFAGIVFMGGPMSVNDDLPWIAPALDLIRQAMDVGIPVLGHCLGGQLMARALGAEVTGNPVPEYGWLPVEVDDNPVAKEWFSRLPPRFEAFHWHGETFACPSGATPVLRSEFCDNQGFVIGNSLALQCHVEMTNDLTYDWVHRAEPGTLTPAPSIQSGDDMLSDLDQKVAAVQKAADAIYAHWIRGLR
jgi:GMP synthase-like glutamine amidotransferase